MFLIAYKQNSRDRTTAKQLHFHHRVVKVQTRRKSAVKWVVLVTFMFLLCYGIFLRSNVLLLLLVLLLLTGHKCGSDFYYKVPLQVIKSGISPIVYAFFKRDRKQKCGRLSFKRRRLLTT